MGLFSRPLFGLWLLLACGAGCWTESPTQTSSRGESESRSQERLQTETVRAPLTAPATETIAAPTASQTPTAIAAPTTGDSKTSAALTTPPAIAIAPTAPTTTTPSPAVATPTQAPNSAVAVAPTTPSIPSSAPAQTAPNKEAAAPNRLPPAVVEPGKIVPLAATSSGDAHGSMAHQAVYEVTAATTAEMLRRNGPIFVDWKTPQAALLITGEQWGYFEPCGCAGLENQKGGMSRRATMLKQLRAQGWPIAPIDVGGMVKRFGRQQEIKFQASIDALRTMGYRAIAWGPKELRLATGEVVAAIAEPDGSPPRVVSANVSLFGADSGLTPRFTIFEVGKRKFGVTSVLSDRLQAEINNPDVALIPAEKALAAVLPELKGKADVLVLLSHGTPEESRKLGERFTDFQFVVTASGADEPPFEPAKLSGPNRLLIDVGHKAMYGVMLGFYDDAKEPVRYQRVPFDARFADSPEMHAIKSTYQQQLQQAGWSGLGIEPKPHPRATDPKDLAGQFVGSEKCGDCHSKAFAIWKDTPHGHATDTLVKLDPPRQFDAECVSCHVTGWNPPEFFPYTTGFLSLAKTPQLVSVGCENCHGPGAAHVAAEEGESGGTVSRGANPLRPATGGGSRDKLRLSMRMPLGTKSDNVCQKCHDIDNSPAFELMQYWERIVHKGKD